MKFPALKNLPIGKGCCACFWCKQNNKQKGLIRTNRCKLEKSKLRARQCRGKGIVPVSTAKKLANNESAIVEFRIPRIAEWAKRKEKAVVPVSKK